MPKRSNKSSRAKKKADKPAIDRPFDSKTLKKAGEIASRYRLILEPDDEVGFIGRSLELPNIFADGKTPDKCVRATLEALVAAVATMLELGERPPAHPPNRFGKAKSTSV